MYPSKLKLESRWYQDEAVDALWHYLQEYDEGNPVVAMPTGTGKSIVIADFNRKMHEYYGCRILNVTHAEELIDQNFKKLIGIWPLAPAGVYSAGLGRRDTIYPITFCGIQSVYKKAASFGLIDLVLVDECHAVGTKESSNYQQFIGGLRAVNPALRVIGLSATPYRLGQGMITDGGLFTDVCYDLTSYELFNRLIAEGWLCPLVPKRTTSELDVSQVGTSKGDFNLNELQAAVDKAEVTRKALAEMVVQGEDRKHWLIFAAGVIHSDHIADMLNQEFGISTISIHSKVTADFRRDGLRDWKAGKIRCVVNNNVLTTGFDFPALDLIAVLRPTKSPGLWVQMLGRGTRPSPGKQNCLVLDFAGNTRRLGPINDPVLPRAKGKGGGGGAPVKVCPACDAYNHASVRFCSCCGEEFIARVKITEHAGTEELIAGEEPVVETFEVDGVEYDRHFSSRSEKMTMKVTYFTGLRRFREWVCLEHPGAVGYRARKWWGARSLNEPPDSVEDALRRVDELRTPSHIRVWVNKKHPEVMDHDFTGSGFLQA